MFNLPPLLAHAVELLAIIILSGVAAGLGLLVLRLLRVGSGLSLGERLLFGLALGYGVMAFAMLALGLLGLIYLPVGLAVLLVMAVVAYRPLAVEVRKVPPYLRQVAPMMRNPANIFLALVITAALLSALFKALVPVATQDDLMYHLALPRRYIEQHAVLFYPDSSYSLFPQLMEMLYTWGLLLGSDRLAVLFAFVAGLIGPAATALFAKRYIAGGREGLWRALPLLAAAIFVSTPLIGYILRAANTDLAQAGFDFLGIYAFWLAVRESPGVGDKSIYLVLSGICCGLAFSVKYYGFAVALSLGVALLVITVRRGLRSRGTERASPAQFILPLVAFGAPFLALAAPWLLRNYISTGNPVWPLAGEVFGGLYWSPQASPETLLGRAPGLSLANLWNGLQYLWDAMNRLPLAIDNQVHVVSLGPLLLTALPALVFARWKPALRLVAYVAAAYWLLWAFFFSHTSARYLSTFFLLAALLGACGLVSLAERFRTTRPLVGAVVAAALGSIVIVAGLSTRIYLPTVLALSQSAEGSYLAAYMEDYPMIQYIAGHTPPDAKIYLWDGQPRGYYIPRPYVYARLVPLYTGFAAAPDIWRARLRELGITHVLVHGRDMLAPGQPLGADPDAPAEQAFAQKYFGPLLFQVGDYKLYQLR